MHLRLPVPLKQTKDDNCALACLRSILAFHGVTVEEKALELLADKREWGVQREALKALLPHAVVPVWIKVDLVGINDPLSGTRKRVSKKKFEAARRDLSRWCVVVHPVGP